MKGEETSSQRVRDNGRKTVGDAGDIGSRRVAARNSHSDTGSVLILALVFVIAVSLIVVALADWATNSLNDSTKFSNASNLHYAASSVTISPFRVFEPFRFRRILRLRASLHLLVIVGAPPMSLTRQLARTTWHPGAATVEYLTQSATRVMTVYTCLLSAEPTGAACQANPLLTAVATFDDYPSYGGPPLQEQCNQEQLTSGEGITLQTWVFGKAIAAPLSTIPQRTGLQQQLLVRYKQRHGGLRVRNLPTVRRG